MSVDVTSILEDTYSVQQAESVAQWLKLLARMAQEGGDSVVHATLTLTLLPDRYAICRMEASVAISALALGATGFVSITRAGDELSIVCAEASVPNDVQSSRGWRCLRVEGPLDFALVGVLASLASPLAEAGISIFAISTYDTDYLLVREGDLAAALQALAAAGHSVYRATQ